MSAAPRSIPRQAAPASFSRRAFAGLLAGGIGGALLFLRRALRREEDPNEPEGQSTVANARPRPPYRAPVFAAGAPALSFLALGDVGWPGSARRAVAATMDRVAGELPFSFVCLLGDNFYENGSAEDGVWSSDDPRWQTD